MFRFSVRNLLRQLVPSRVLEFFVDSSATSSSHFVEYDSWDEAVAASEGWDSKLIVDKLRDATMQVVQGEKTYERDSILFDRVSYSFPLLSSILLAAATSAGPLRIIDFGGGLGTSFRQNEEFLSRLKIPLEWRVVELPKMVEIGRSTFSTSQLSFHETIEQAAGGGRIWLSLVVLHSTSTILAPSFQRQKTFFRDILFWTVRLSEQEWPTVSACPRLLPLSMKLHTR